MADWGLPGRLALAWPVLVITGCGAGWRAPEPERPPPPVVALPETPRPPAPAEPEPERPQPPPSRVEPAVTPASVVAQSNYPLPRIWEWTLADDVRVWFRRSAGDPGRLLVRARAPGGWHGLPGGAPSTLHGRGGIRLHLFATEAVIEGEGVAGDPAELAQRVADILAGRLPDAGAMSAEVAVNAAMVGERPGRDATPAALMARFGRPGTFHVLFSGDVAPDTFIAAVAPVLGRIRAGADVLAPNLDTTTAPTWGLSNPAGRPEVIPDDGLGSRAVVGFSATVGGPTAERRPDHVRAGLDIVAQVLAAQLEAEGLRPDVRVDLDGAVATLVITVPSEDPASTARRVVAAAVDLQVSEAAVARARGRAVDAHERMIERPSGWIHWLEFLSTNPVDPRSVHHYTRTLRAVPDQRVRSLAALLLGPQRSGAVVLVEPR